MNKSLVKKAVSTIIVFVMMLSFTGCSEFLEEIAIEKVTDYMDEVLTNFISSPYDTVEDNSQTEVEFTTLTSEQEQLALDNLSSVSYSIKKIKMNEERTEATVTVEFKNVMDFFDNTDLVANMDDLADFFDDCATKTYPLNFKVLRADYSWIIADMSDVNEVFFAPYEDICVLDEEGYPINITSGYVNTIFVDSYWYDPIQANPTNNTTFNSCLYLQHVFYFNQPMTMSFTAELRRDGTVVDSYEINLDRSVIATCDFENENGTTYAAGSYTIALVFNGEDIVESSAATVR